MSQILCALHKRARPVGLRRSLASYDYSEALEIVSQELGHFRPDITEVYLR